ncbi:hypothetical protein PHMEG_00022916 [Phytophthora megakarya]|uniref:RxLR effector protein n=1 Tax=Phytophthora megakarya TaxID=4795 RepID=A0A225VIY0_9STRA|nr:hypothetical protein PHMEG_00022916 [Phytophthora megakarya]
MKNVQLATPNIQRVGAENNRLLRTGEVVDVGTNPGNDLDEQERGFTPIELFRTSKLWYDKMRAFAKMDDVTEKLAFVNGLNNQMFEAIKKSGATPHDLYKKFNIYGKLQTAAKFDDLSYDGNYMLWSSYSLWWREQFKVNSKRVPSV